MKSIIPYGTQSISDEDIKEVNRVLRSDFLTQGPEIKKFEDSLSKYSKSKYTLSFTSATAALHIACKALEITDGDLVWTSAISFVASANCVLYCGGKVDFLDINYQTNNISINALKKKLSESKKNNTLPKALIVVHMAGLSLPMKEIKELSVEYNFKIIEDASHAVGGTYAKQPIGNCKYSDATIFSFHPVKIITTGEGGALTTNNRSLYKKAGLLRSHGITRDKSDFKHKNNCDWYYEQKDLGFNYRMTDIQAALGNSQLKRIPTFITKRKNIAFEYLKMFSSLPILMPTENEIKDSSNHLFIVKVLSDKGSHHRDSLFKFLREQNILANLHYIPIYRHPFFEENFEILPSNFPESEKYYDTAISLPIFPSMTKEQLRFVIKRVQEFFK